MNELASDGFSYKVEKIFKGTGLGRLPGSSNVYPDLGYTIGTWNMSHRALGEDASLTRNTNGSFPQNKYGSDMWNRHYTHAWYSVSPLSHPFMLDACSHQRCQDLASTGHTECKANANRIFSNQNVSVEDVKTKCFARASTDQDKLGCELQYASLIKLITDSRDKYLTHCNKISPDNCRVADELGNLKKVLSANSPGVPTASLTVQDFSKRYSQVVSAYGNCDTLIRENADYLLGLKIQGELQYHRENP